MPLKVLVVDDSNFFQHRLTEIINEHSELTVIGVASNGKEAVEKALALKPDIITMDYEMPVMDGVTAVRQIMAQRPVPILMFSSMTYEGARTTLDALDAGATDFMPKNFAEVSRDSEALKKRLHDRLLQIARPAGIARGVPRATTATSFSSSLGNSVAGSVAGSATTPITTPAAENRASLKGRVNLLVIGASTGGPVALAEVLTKLPANFPLPIVLVQHMPESFTKAFAERLDRQCNIEVREAVDGDQLRPGLALLAPGGKQLMIEKKAMGCVRVLPGDSRVNYKPSLDITFGSAANSYGKHVLGVVLTGMGADGCEGARMLKKIGAHIWSQDQESCVIYGMPMAVAREKLTDRVLSLKDMGPSLAREF